MSNDFDFDAWPDSHLQRYSMDLLSVLEKSGTLEESVTTDDADGIRDIISQTPDAMCFLMEIYHDSDIVISIEKQDCLPTGRRRLITRRTFIASNGQTELYDARVYSWYKEA